MSITELSDAAANIDAMTEAAASTFYELGVKFNIFGYPKRNVRKSRNWPKFVQIARKCLLSNVSVEAFVTAAFKKTLEHHAIVTVNDINTCNVDILSKQDEYQGTASPQDLWNMLSCKLIDMLFAIDGVKGTQELLDSSMYGFPAWFRVFSPEKPPQDIIVHWGDIAYDELLENKKLEEYLKNKRPETYNLLKSVVKNI
jgi:hypothetical protein